MESDESNNIGRSVGGTILSVQPLISTTAETTEERDEKSKPTNAIIIGASVGGLIVGVILIVFLLRYKERKR